MRDLLIEKTPQKTQKLLRLQHLKNNGFILVM